MKYKDHDISYTEDEMQAMLKSSGCATMKEFFTRAEQTIADAQAKGTVMHFDNALKLVSEPKTIHTPAKTEKIIPRGIDLDPPSERADFEFAPAKKTDTHMKIALEGVSGSGKTYSSLLLAKTLAKGGKIAVIDTENNSAVLYNNLAKFDTLILRPPYEPNRYIQAIKLAEQKGYSVLVIDSISHMWTGSGGILESVEDITKTKDRRTAWRQMTPEYESFLEAVKNARMHIICTMRTKSKLLENEDANGKKVMTKSADEPVMRDGIEYEFTTVLDIHISHLATASKDRTSIFDTIKPSKITDETGNLFLKWLEGR